VSGNGLLVADDDSWGESLYRALVDREFRAGLVINAQQQIKIEYSDEIYEKQFDSFLSRLAIKLNQCDKSQEESAIE